MPFRVKICGITTSEDAAIVGNAGVDAIGLNFYSGSKRYVSSATACEIVKQLPRNVKRVGVFVNATLPMIETAVATLGLDVVQLHGDEPSEFVTVSL